MVLTPKAPERTGRPLSWSASTILGALFVIGQVVAYRLIEMAFGGSVYWLSPATLLTVGVGIPASILLMRYVSVWLIDSNAGSMTAVWVMTMASLLPQVVPFDGTRSVAHAAASAAVSFVVFFAASRQHR